MKIILSRKGFDSGSGGCPSPILPDGSLVSLPIPDARSGIRFGDVLHNGEPLSKLTAKLTREKYTADSGAHLDPDLSEAALPRQAGWRPLFGQSGAAQGHLRNQGVREGDLFLFFGLFRPVIEGNTGWEFDRRQPARHLLWGWLQIGAVYPVTEEISQKHPWAAYHPHFRHPEAVNNYLYAASDALSLNGRQSLSGAGVFRRDHPELRLTEPGADRTGIWSLPEWFYPSSGRPAMSYHSKPERWQKVNGKTRLQAASRGQEFVLDASFYPEAAEWAATLVEKHGS